MANTFNSLGWDLYIIVFPQKMKNTYRKCGEWKREREK